METQALFRDGKYLVAGKNAAFPDRCVFCAKSAGGNKQKYKYFFNEEQISLVNAKSAYGLISAAGMHTKLKVAVCGPCHRRKQFTLWLAMGLVGLGFAIGGFAAIVSPRHDDRLQSLSPLLFLLFLLCFFGGAYLVLRFRNPLKEVSTDNALVWLEGASPAFLADLPDISSRKES